MGLQGMREIARNVSYNHTSSWPFKITSELLSQCLERWMGWATQGLVLKEMLHNLCGEYS